MLPDSDCCGALVGGMKDTHSELLGNTISDALRQALLSDLKCIPAGSLLVKYKYAIS